MEAVSDALRTATWRQREVAVGVSWRQARLPRLFDAPQQVTVLRIDRHEPSLRLRVAAPESGLAPTSTLATAAGSVAAVNGGFFAKDGTAEGLLRIDGKPGRYNERRGAVMLGIRDDSVTLRDTPADGAADFTHALAAGPWLVRSGTLQPEPGAPRHPRTAVGSDAHAIWFVTVDGRAQEAAGMTMHELAQLLRALGCDDALNLDGGGSTTMWVRSLGGVVNCPCDDKAFDPAGERAVANAVLLQGRAVWTWDEEAAEFAPKDAWLLEQNQAAIDGDLAVTKRGGTATFKLPVERAGEWTVEVCARRGERIQWSIGTQQGTLLARRDGYSALDAVEIASPAELVLTLSSPAQLTVDAVRVIEAER